MKNHERYSVGASMGAWFRCLRNYHKLTLEEVSKSSGINRTRLHRLERDGTSTTVLEMLDLAQVYNISQLLMLQTFYGIFRSATEPIDESLRELFESD